jgi:hypothetical protein
MTITAKLPETMCILNPETWRPYLIKKGFDLETKYFCYRNPEGEYVFIQDRDESADGDYCCGCGASDNACRVPV